MPLCFAKKIPRGNGGSLAYPTFLIRESRRSDGEGWRDYISIFQQQATSAADLEWAKVNHSLLAVIFLVQSSGRGKAYKLCQGSDHKSEVCALAPHRATLGELASWDRKTTPWEGQSWHPKTERIRYSWNGGRCAAKTME